MADRELNFNVTANARGVSGGMINVRKEIRETERALDKAKTGAERYSEAMEDIQRKQDLGLLNEGEAQRLRSRAGAQRLRESPLGEVAGALGMGRFIPKAGGPIALLTASIAALTTSIRGMAQAHRDILNIGQRAAAMAMPGEVQRLSRLENNLRLEGMSEGAQGQTVSALARIAQQQFGGDLNRAAQFLDRTVGGARGIQQIEMAQQFGLSPEVFQGPLTLEQMLNRPTAGETRPSDVAAARLRQRAWSTAGGLMRAGFTGMLRGDATRIGDEFGAVLGRSIMETAGPNDPFLRYFREVYLQGRTEGTVNGIGATGMGAN